MLRPSLQINKLWLCRYSSSMTSAMVRLNESFVGKIFKTLPSVKSFFKDPKYKNNANVQELLDTYQEVMDENKYYRELELINKKKLPKKPFIVIEGLDGSGKTTQAEKIVEHFGATYSHTPPEYLNDIKRKFTKLSIVERTAFYTLGNYFASMEILSLIRTNSVVLDRFWHSTVAYAIAQELMEEPKKCKMPFKSDQIFEWPIDLLKPDAVILLTVSEDVRRFRQFNRRSITQQEHMLNTNKEYRNNALEAFIRMRNPGLTLVDSNASSDKVFENIIKALESFGITNCKNK